jgi:hypothetical protein
MKISADGCIEQREGGSKIERKEEGRIEMKERRKKKSDRKNDSRLI